MYVWALLVPATACMRLTSGCRCVPFTYLDVDGDAIKRYFWIDMHGACIHACIQKLPCKSVHTWEHAAGVMCTYIRAFHVHAFASKDSTYETVISCIIIVLTADEQQSEAFHANPACMHAKPPTLTTSFPCKLPSNPCQACNDIADSAWMKPLSCWHCSSIDLSTNGARLSYCSVWHCYSK